MAKVTVKPKQAGFESVRAVRADKDGSAVELRLGVVGEQQLRRFRLPKSVARKLVSDLRRACYDDEV